jgi:hypothetical protein
MDPLIRIQRLYDTGTQFQNFDFGKNWSQIIPFLTDPDFRDTIWEAYDAIQEHRPYPIDYDGPPSQMVRSDAVVTLLDRIFDHLRESRDSRVPEDVWKSYEDLTTNGNDDDDEVGELFENLQNIILRLAGFDWNTNRNCIIFWVVTHECHDWNPTFGLWLARRICPDEPWEILSSQKHTTVFSAKSNRVFDILLWSCDDRLFDTAVGHRYKSKDLTLGGQEAIQMILMN